MKVLGIRPAFALAVVLPVAVFMSSCAATKPAKPPLPVQEYERMIVGRLDADYVGTDNCVAKCHKHAKITDDFKHSVHGEQLKPDTQLPLVNCESCHGPGSLAIQNLPDDPAVNDAQNNKCDFKTFLDISNLPAQAQSLICLKCHSSASMPTLSHWNASAHALNEVSCLDCHKLHQGPQQKVKHEEMAELCYGCHPHVRTENSLFSRHPFQEKKISCTDCHDVHGSTQDNLLRGNTPKETCTRCHMEKQGPFVFEHGDVTENCANCHAGHGSTNNYMLNATMPFLCLQCHSGHMLGTADQKQLFANRCTDCHSQIHGTDVPASSLTGPGTLRQ